MHQCELVVSPWWLPRLGDRRWHGVVFQLSGGRMENLCISGDALRVDVATVVSDAGLLLLSAMVTSLIVECLFPFLSPCDDGR